MILSIENLGERINSQAQLTVNGIELDPGQRFNAVILGVEIADLNVPPAEVDKEELSERLTTIARQTGDPLTAILAAQIVED